MTTQTWTSLQEACAIALTQQLGTNLTAFSDTFNAQFPQATSYAENRICREIPFLNNRVISISPGTITTSGVWQINASVFQPGLNLMVVEEFGLLTPANNGQGTLVPYNRVSLDFLLRVWPGVYTTQVAPSLSSNYGRYFAMQTDQVVAFVPPVQDAYYGYLVGLYAPTPISATNKSTYLSKNYPELLTAGCMVFLTGALTRNFGAQADEAAQAVSWETQFLKLLEAAKDEEMRRRGLRPDTPIMPQMAHP